MAQLIDFSNPEVNNNFASDIKGAKKGNSKKISAEQLIEKHYEDIKALIESNGSDDAFQILVNTIKKRYKVTLTQSTIRSYYSKVKKKKGDSKPRTSKSSVDSSEEITEKLESNSGRKSEKSPTALPKSSGSNQGLLSY